MRKSNVITAILSTASLVWIAPAHAADVTLDYHLPEVKIGFAASHMITSCPNAQGVGFAMDVATAIKPVYGRGEQILINPKGNLFVDRQVKLEYHENGTLKSFNGSSTGQGGKFVAAAIKAASFVATSAMGLPVVGAAFDGGSSTRPIQCKKKIVDLLKQKEGLETELARLRQNLISQGTSENLLLQITRTEEAIANTNSQLTVSPKPVIWTPTASTIDLPSNPNSADLTAWFEDVTKEDLQTALNAVGLGQVLAFKASATSVMGRDTKPTPKTKQRALVYRVPGVIEVTLEPLASFAPGNLTGIDEAHARAAYEDTKAKETVRVPQIGTLKIISFDGSGIFGSRAVAATFDQKGELTSIGYTSTGGADALAGVVDASVAAGIELRDQETNATKREVERRTQANALEALIEAEAKNDVPAPAPADAAGS
ncbi:hypothetical protein FHS91_003956 [Sphingobium xanthum]|uniref:hypothetical protein n=1 Tax=Sphingobium xanthum TaxID=1387165 RepID=UPI001C8BB439|nr:hypothetical protein [Sphingobium xanthum]